MSITRDIDFVPGFDLYHNIHLELSGVGVNVTGSVFTMKVYRRQGSPLLATANVNTFFQATGHIGFSFLAATTDLWPPDCYYEIGKDGVALLVGRLAYRGINSPFNTDTTIDTGSNTVIDLGYAIELENQGVGTPTNESGELRKYRVAMASRTTSPVDIVVIGDSITEGWTASGRPTRYVGAMATKLANNIGSYTPGDGYVPAFITGGGFFFGYGTPGWTTNAGTPTVNTTYGLGERAVNLPVGARIQIVNTMSRFHLYYPEYPSAGSFQIWIDGVNTATVNPANAVTTGSRRWDSGNLGAAASHTIEIRQSGANAAIVEGAYFFGTEQTAFVRVWESGHFGYRAEHYVGGRSWDGFDTILPDLVIINLGTNDSFAWTPAVFQSNLTTMVTELLAKVVGLAPSLLFIVPWGTDAVADQAAFLPYAAAIRAVANLFGGAVFDWNAIVPVNPDTYGLTFSGDMTHPTTTGHQMLGDHIAQYLIEAGAAMAAGAGGGGGDPAVGGDLSGVASNAQIVAGAVGTTELAALAVTDAKVAAANKDGTAGTPSMRTLGTGATQAAQGSLAEYVANKGAASGYAGLGSDTKVPTAQLGTGTADGTTFLRGDKTWAAPSGGGDPAVGGDLSGTASTAQIVAGAVGTTELAALAVTDAKVAAANKDGTAGTPSMRTLGTGATQAAGGADTRITGAEQVANKAAASGYASLDGTTKVPTAQLATGTANTGTWLRGDRAWTALPVDDPTMGGDLSGLSSNAQIVAGAVGTTELGIATMRRPFAAKTGAYTFVAADEIITADATSAAFSVTLPTAVGATGKLYEVKRLNAGVNAVTLITTSSQTIDGATSYVLTLQYESVKVVSDGANWLVI